MPEITAREEEIRIRVTHEEKALYASLADKEQRTLSSWMRRLAAQEAGRINCIDQCNKEHGFPPYDRGKKER